jgi:hypothetical protein
VTLEVWAATAARMASETGWPSASGRVDGYSATDEGEGVLLSSATRAVASSIEGNLTWNST